MWCLAKEELSLFPRLKGDNLSCLFIEAPHARLIKDGLGRVSQKQESSHYFRYSTLTTISGNICLKARLRINTNSN